MKMNSIRLYEPDFNVNTLVKGIHFIDEYSLPITNNDAKFRFFNHLVAWLDRWEHFPESGKLSKQIFTSLMHPLISLNK